MPFLWQERRFCTKLLAAGKLPRECLYPSSRRYSQASIDARHTECVPTLSDIIKSKAAYIQGKVNDHHLDILLDSGASCSVMRDEYMTPTNLDPPQDIRLTNADGREITTLGTTTAIVTLGNLEINHKFTVVRELAAPAIWQFPMEKSSIEKTAFCPGPGYGLWEFSVMPYGLTGATQTCQRGLDTFPKTWKPISAIWKWF